MERTPRQYRNGFADDRVGVRTRIERGERFRQRRPDNEELRSHEVRNHDFEDPSREVWQARPEPYRRPTREEQEAEEWSRYCQRVEFALERRLDNEPDEENDHVVLRTDDWPTAPATIPRWARVERYDEVAELRAQVDRLNTTVGDLTGAVEGAFRRLSINDLPTAIPVPEPRDQRPHVQAGSVFHCRGPQRGTVTRPVSEVGEAARSPNSGSPRSRRDHRQARGNNAYYGAVWATRPGLTGVYLRYCDYSERRPGAAFHKRFRTLEEAEHYVRTKAGWSPNTAVPVFGVPRPN